jgi:hypothetical protein
MIMPQKNKTSANSKKKETHPKTTDSQVPEVTWLVMVYMAADNSLAAECVFSLTEILRTLQDSRIAVMAQFDSHVTGIQTKRYNFSPGSYTSGFPQRLCDAEESFPQSSVDEELPILGPQATTIPPTADPQIPPVQIENSAAPAALEDFLITGIQKYPKARTLVILSGHGSGALDGFLSDSNPPGSLSIPNLGSALNRVKIDCGKEIDILGMDSCLMSMAEVCRELSGSAKYLVGSEGFVLSGGWPYRDFLDALQAAPNMTPKQLAKTLVREYIRYYSDYVAAGISVDQSASDLEKSIALTKAVEKLVNSLTDTKRKTLKPSVISPLIVAHWRAQSYQHEQFVDLKDFSALLKEEIEKIDKTDQEGVGQACVDVGNAVDDMVQVFGYCGGLTQHSNGLSIYFPWSKSELPTIREYSQLQFAKSSKWDEFLGAYVKVTQRELRQTPTKFQCGKKTLLPVTLADSSPTAIRTNNAADTKTNNAAGTKTNNAADTKTNNAAGTKSVVVLVPAVKNPPGYYIDYEQNCKVKI